MTVPANNVNIELPDLEVGVIVTFTFEKRNMKDMPENVKIERLRKDLTWQEVIHNSHTEKKYLNGMNEVREMRVVGRRIELNIEL